MLLSGAGAKCWRGSGTDTNGLTNAQRIESEGLLMRAFISALRESKLNGDGLARYNTNLPLRLMLCFLSTSGHNIGPLMTNV